MLTCLGVVLAAIYEFDHFPTVHTPLLKNYRGVPSLSFSEPLAKTNRRE